MGFAVGMVKILEFGSGIGSFDLGFWFGIWDSWD